MIQSTPIMEIDFLGLKSSQYTMHLQDSSKDSFPETAWSGGVETSLSLSTTTRCSFDYQTEDERRKKKKKWESPAASEKMTNYNHGSLPRTEQPGLVLVSRPVFGFSSPSGFLYFQNENPWNKPELSSQPSSLRTLYSGCATADKATPSSAIGLSGDMRICTRGYTPTVAMARKATLARFLEKRLHRMTRGRTNLMGKSVSRIRIHVPVAAKLLQAQATRRDERTTTSDYDFNQYSHALLNRTI